jgi:hypothetical protein
MMSDPTMTWTDIIPETYCPAVYGINDTWICRVGYSDMDSSWCGWVQRRSNRTESYFIDGESLAEAKAIAEQHIKEVEGGK